MALWIALERPFLSDPYQVNGRRTLSLKIRVTAACLFAVTVGEYVLVSIQKVLSFNRRFEHCDWTAEKQVERFFLYESSYFFDQIPYGPISVALMMVCEW